MRLTDWRVVRLAAPDSRVRLRLRTRLGVWVAAYLSADDAHRIGVALIAAGEVPRER